MKDPIKVHPMQIKELHRLLRERIATPKNNYQEIMNKIKQSLFLLFMTYFGTAYSQNQDIDTSPEWNGIIAGDFYEMSEYIPGLEGTKYMFTDWLEGSIFFYSGLGQDDLVFNYHLENNNLEIRTDEEIKVCDLNLLKAFKLKDGRIFMNNREFDQSLGFGVSELLYKGKISLIRTEYIEIQKPTYVKSHDVGEKDSKILHKFKYYIVKDGKAMLLNKKMKKNVDVFNSHFDKLAAYTKANSFKLNNERHIVLVAKKFDELL